MVIYVSVMMLCTFIAAITTRANKLTLHPGKKHNNLPAFICCALIVTAFSIIAGWRDRVGTDYGNYLDIWLLTKDQAYSSIINERESLFGILIKVCSSVFGKSQSMFYVSAILTITLFIIGIKKMSASFTLSVFLFVAGMYYFDAFNGMRQCIATAIMFCAYPLVQRKKWLRLILITAVAVGFHTSAVVILAVFVISKYMKAFSIGVWVTVGIFALIYVFYGSFLNGLLDVIAKSGTYSNYETMLLDSDSGANILRFAFSLVPTLAATYFLPSIRKRRNDADSLIIISMFNALFMMIATRHWIFARICMFFGVYNILLWPEIVNCFAVKNRKFVALAVASVYFIYFYLIVQVDSNLLPYRSFLFGGVWS